LGIFPAVVFLKQAFKQVIHGIAG